MLEDLCLFFGRQDLGFKRFEFFGDVTLCLGQCLLTNPCLWHFVFVCIPNLEVIPKHVVEGNLQPADARGFGFSVTNGIKRFLAVEGQIAHFVQWGIDALGNDFPLANARRGFFHQLLLQAIQERIARRETLQEWQQRIFTGRQVSDFLHCDEAAPDVSQFAGIDSPGAGFGGQALQIADRPKDLTDVVPQTHFLGQPIYGDMAHFDVRFGRQWCDQRPAQGPSAHGGACAVEDVHQASAVGVVRVQDFKIPHREGIEPHALFGTQSANALNVFELTVMCCVQVVKDDTCRDGGVRRIVQPKPLQRTRGELLFDLVECMGFGEHPIVESGPCHVVPKQRTNVAFTLPVDQPLFGLQTSQDAVDPTRVTFRDLEFASAQIKQRQPHGFRGPMDGCDIVVGLAFKHVVVHHQSRSHQFCDASLHQSLGLLGVFELVAHGHLQSRFDELGQVSVEAVVRESGQLHL